MPPRVVEAACDGCGRILASRPKRPSRVKKFEARREAGVPLYCRECAERRNLPPRADVGVFPDVPWWLPAYPSWCDPLARIGDGCQICACKVNAHNRLVMHHVYSRQVRPEVVPLCRVCEGAVHGRNEGKPGLEVRVAQLRALLPAFAVEELRPAVGSLEARLVMDGAIEPFRRRLASG